MVEVDKQGLLMAATALLSKHILIDGHNDLPAALRKVRGYSVDDLDIERDDTHTDLVRLRRGKIGGQFWSVWVPSYLDEAQAVVATLEQIDAVYRLVARYPNDLGIAFTAEESQAQFARGRIASLLGVEGGHSIAGSLGTLRMFARLGVRYVTLTHNDDTSWAASATGVDAGAGLRPDGEAIVREMNRIGLIVDLSHTAESTQLDALRVSEAPVIFSHSSLRRVTDHPRNVSDLVLSALVANGGVLQCTFVPEFVSAQVAQWDEDRRALCARLGIEADNEGHLSGTKPRYPSAPMPGETHLDALERNERERRARTSTISDRLRRKLRAWHDANPMPAATLQQVADHFEAARDQIGIEHLGVSGDYDGTALFPQELENVSSYPNLFAELLSRSWSELDLARLAGENILRVMKDVEGHAQEPMWPSAASPGSAGPSRSFL